MFSNAGCGIFALKLFKLIFGDDSGKYQDSFTIDRERAAVAVTGEVFDKFPRLTFSTNAAGQFTARYPVPAVITGLFALCAVFEAFFAIPLPFDLFDPAAAVKIFFSVVIGINNFIRFSQRISAEQAHHRRFHTVVLERTLESPWVSKATKPVHPEGNQS